MAFQTGREILIMGRLNMAKQLRIWLVQDTEPGVSLEKDGTLKLEKIYREQRAVPGNQGEQAETGNRTERPKAQNGTGKAGAGDEKSGSGSSKRKPGEKAKPVGKPGVKQRGEGQGAADNTGQSGRGREQRNGSGRK